jgi:hypothetical protein
LRANGFSLCRRAWPAPALLSSSTSRPLPSGHRDRPSARLRPTGFLVADVVLVKFDPSRSTASGPPPAYRLSRGEIRPDGTTSLPAYSCGFSRWGRIDRFTILKSALAPGSAVTQFALANVRFGSLADIGAPSPDVRCAPESGHPFNRR